MADSYGALIKTTTVTTGTLDYVLATTALTTPHRTPKQAVADGSLTDGDIVQYMARDTTVTGDASFEIGEGVYTDATDEIARDAANVHDGSNGPGALTVWPGSGVRDVYLVVTPSVQTARLDRSNTFLSTGSFTQTIESTDNIAQLVLDGDPAGSLPGQIAFQWDGTVIGLIRSVKGDDTVNKDEGDLAFFVADGGVLSRRITINQEGRVGIGVTDAVTDVHVQENSTDTIPTMEIEQLGVGDAALQFSIVGDSYAIGIDNSDGDKFKISYAASAGGAVLGVNDRLFLDPAGLFSFPNDVIFGSTSVTPDGNVHIHSGSAGSVAAISTADELVIEGSTTNVGISMLGPDPGSTQLVFGSPNDSVAAFLQWQASTANNLILATAISGGEFFMQTGDQVETFRCDSNQNFIVGGAPGTNSSAGIELISTTKAILNARMTTTQRDALTAVNGMQIYNTTTNQMEGFINGSWTAM